MALSPDDIVNHEFKQALRGYAVQEVDDLLDRLADQLERAERDIAELRQRVADADARATEALATGSILRQTLITAQDAAQHTMEAASIEAEKVRSDADREASQQLDAAIVRSAALLEEAETEAVTIRASYRSQQEAATGRVVELAVIEDRYRAQLRSLLEHQLGQLDLLEADGSPGGREVAELRDAHERVGDERAGDDGSDAPLDGSQGSGDGDAGEDDDEGEPEDSGGPTVGLRHEEDGPSGREGHDPDDGPDRDPSA